MNVVAFKVNKRRWEVTFGGRAYVLTFTKTPHTHLGLWHVWKDDKPFGTVSKSFGAAYEQARIDAQLNWGEVT